MYGNNAVQASEASFPCGTVRLHFVYHKMHSIVLTAIIMQYYYCQVQTFCNILSHHCWLTNRKFTYLLLNVICTPHFSLSELRTRSYFFSYQWTWVKNRKEKLYFLPHRLCLPNLSLRNEVQCNLDLFSL